MCIQYAEYSSGAMGQILQCGRHICSGAYVNNAKYMYASIPRKFLDNSEFICMQTHMHTP